MLIAILGRAILLALVTSVGMLAQTGQITGLVTDPSSTAVPGAAVVVTNVATAVRHEVTTNDQGYYTVLFLSPGDYKIRVQKQGFKAAEHPAIKLDVAQIARIISDSNSERLPRA
jgi:phosphatidate phosphatase APP1